jgi:hypothetical protein
LTFVETLAFYSYKGGVGRSLLLANAARFLAALGKGVVVLDFDFEAPGLHYKFSSAQSALQGPASGGVVPYLVATAEGSVSPPPLERHLVSVPVPSDAQGWLSLMPAGPAPHPAYWAACKELSDRLRLGDPNGQGFMALLDLQARIQEELRPDYLLIDARTGVTELGGLATSILADTVVCLFVPNQESLDGTLTVVEALKGSIRLKGQKPLRLVPVVSRTMAKLPDDERFASGARRLLELGVGRKTGKVDSAALLSLPHDDVVGSWERIVGGERTASAFSPLYRAYLELFQTLFPARAEPARTVLERLTAVAEIRESLTRPQEGAYPGDQALAAWNPSAIEEGVVFEAEGQRIREARYVDLLCRGDDGRPLMAVEYVGDGGADAAAEFWDKGTRIRCVVLLGREKNASYVSRQMLTRPPNGALRPVNRWDLPRPREFELLPDVGDRSVDSMLNALRHGHVEAAAWLVTEWRESVMVSDTPKMRRGRWRPQRARRILDGLAATEDLTCAEAILRSAAPDDYDRRRLGFRFREEWASHESERMVAYELFAPLFWRLPVEAVLGALEPRRHPGDTLPLAGYRLVASRLMGLYYEPDERALAEAHALASWPSGPASEREDAEEHALRWVHRSRHRRARQIVFPEEPPPALVWQEALLGERFWSGTLEEAREKGGARAGKLLSTRSALRSRIRAMANRRDLVIHGLLGDYEPSGRLVLYPAVIAAAAEVLGVAERHLKSIVFIHLSTWALAHQATDLDGQPGYGFAPSPHSSPFLHVSPVHVAIVQGFAHRLLRELNDPNLRATFETLSTHQPEPYTRWRRVQRMPLEKLRLLLLRARSSGPAIGLPSGGNG